MWKPLPVGAGLCVAALLALAGCSSLPQLGGNAVPPASGSPIAAEVFALGAPDAPVTIDEYADYQ